MLLKQIQYFMAVAECKHFTRAADRLFVSQSALSQQITKLENDLCVKLINRINHPIELTPAGQDFMQYAIKILDDISALQNQLQKYRPCQGQNTIRIGMITGLGNINIADILSSFNTKFSNINFTLTNNLSKELCRKLNDDELDLALFAAPYNIKDYDFDFISLGKEDFVCIVPKLHSFAQKKMLNLKDAKDEKFIFPSPENVSYDIFLTECRRSGFSPHIISYCNEPGRRVDLVNAGLGISLISLSGLQYYNCPDITVLPLAKPFYKHIVLARKKQKHTFSSLQTFWNYIQKYEADYHYV